MIEHSEIDYQVTLFDPVDFGRCEGRTGAEMLETEDGVRWLTWALQQSTIRFDQALLSQMLIREHVTETTIAKYQLRCLEKCPRPDYMTAEQHIALKKRAKRRVADLRNEKNERLRNDKLEREAADKAEAFRRVGAEAAYAIFASNRPTDAASGRQIETRIMGQIIAREDAIIAQITYRK